MVVHFLLFILFLCWGSFLNVVGYRIIHGYSIVLPRSFCPQCRTTLAWYDLIPVVSWLLLRAQCRSCKSAISRLYPLIEILTAVTFMLLISFIEPRYWLGYGLFFSALIVIIRTDAETMFVSRYTTLFLVPAAWALSFFKLLPLSLFQSIVGALFGYALMWLIAKIYLLVRKQEGMGEGDFDILALVGAFTGFVGAWITLLIGALLGSFIGIIALAQGASLRVTKIPFGPWLSLGALMYTLIQPWFNFHDFIFYAF
jgi:prepilin signal peptidase PulO-like enzyme (type II secretory pathway)